MKLKEMEMSNRHRFKKNRIWLWICHLERTFYITKIANKKDWKRDQQKGDFVVCRIWKLKRRA